MALLSVPGVRPLTSRPGFVEDISASVSGSGAGYGAYSMANSAYSLGFKYSRCGACSIRMDLSAAVSYSSVSNLNNPDVIEVFLDRSVHQCGDPRVVQFEKARSRTRNLCIVIRGKAQTRKALQDLVQKEKLKEEQRELLAEVRSRKKLTWLQRQESLSREDSVVKKVWPFWRRIEKAELESRSLTRRIVELGKRKQLDQVFRLLEECKKNNWKFDRITMNAVVAACVNSGDVDRALQVYREMFGEYECGVDNVTYGTLIRGLGEAGRLDDAFEVVETIVGGLAPGHPKLTDVHINTLVNACIEAGDPLRARAVLLRYRTSLSKTSLSVVTYNLLLKGYARAGNAFEALKIKEEMINQGIQLQRLTYNTLILACVNAKKMDQAHELLNEMKVESVRLKTDELLPDVVTYTTLLKGAGNVDCVLKLRDEIKTSSTCVMDRVAYSAMIDACISVGAPEEGLQVLKEMKVLAQKDSQLRPKSHAFLALMRAYAERGDIEVVNLLKSQIVSESSGNVSVEDRAEADELMIEAAVNSGEIALARHLLRTMMGLKKGVPLTDRAHTVLVRLQALVGFTDDRFKPYMLRPGVYPYEKAETVMTSIEESRPLLSSAELKKVVMRFWTEDSIPVVDDRGACVGIVHSKDIVKMDGCIQDVMRGPPVAVTTSTVVLKAVHLLLDPRVNFFDRGWLSGYSSHEGKF